ncbi:MAG: phenylacetic acid degradation protein PaaN, partial [Fulvivirga sp.]
MSLYKKHKDILTKAIKAIHDRTFFAAYPEHPAPSIYGETADADGRKKFQGSIGKKFEELNQENPSSWVGVEESPYLQEPLNIQYPAFDTKTLIERADKAFHIWRKVTADDRAGILIESLERIKQRFFEVA